MKREKTLSDLKDIHLECRAQRHAWQFFTDESLVYDGRRLVQYTQVDHCMRGCGTTRARILDGEGNIIKAKPHTYDSDYLLGYRVSNAEVRHEAFERRHREAPEQPGGETPRRSGGRTGGRKTS